MPSKLRLAMPRKLRLAMPSKLRPATTMTFTIRRRARSLSQTRPDLPNVDLPTAACLIWQVQFLPLDPRDTDSVDQILAQVDNAIQ